MRIINIIRTIFNTSEIKSLTTSYDVTYHRIPKGHPFVKNNSLSGGYYPDECIIRHIGGHIYLVGVFDHYKQGYSRGGCQNRANQFRLIFPSGIKVITYK
jgi:hypothetical protein